MNGSPSGNTSHAPASGGSTATPEVPPWSMISLLGSARCASRPEFDDRQRSRWWRTITIRVWVTTVGMAAHRQTRACSRQRGHRPRSSAMLVRHQRPADDLEREDRLDALEDRQDLGVGDVAADRVLLGVAPAAVQDLAELGDL